MNQWTNTSIYSPNRGFSDAEREKKEEKGKKKRFLWYTKSTRQLIRSPLRIGTCAHISQGKRPGRPHLRVPRRPWRQLYVTGPDWSLARCAWRRPRWKATASHTTQSWRPQRRRDHACGSSRLIDRAWRRIQGDLRAAWRGRSPRRSHWGCRRAACTSPPPPRPPAAGRWRRCKSGAEFILILILIFVFVFIFILIFGSDSEGDSPWPCTSLPVIQRWRGAPSRAS